MPVYKLPDEGVNIILYYVNYIHECEYVDMVMQKMFVGMVSVVRGQRRNGVLWWCARGVMYAV